MLQVVALALRAVELPIYVGAGQMVGQRRWAKQQDALGVLECRIRGIVLHVQHAQIT